MKVHYIFRSISGEVGWIPQGAITWFVRFQGCNLRCEWCDTLQAQSASGHHTEMTPWEIAHRIPPRSNVILTGGEPLMQDRNDLTELVEILCSPEYDCTIQIETNGSIVPFLPIPHILDYKTPSSGMMNRMIADIHYMNAPQDSWVKFVVKDADDLEFSIDTIRVLENSLLNFALSVEDGLIVEQALSYLSLNVKNSIELMPRLVFNFQLHKKFNLP